MSDNLIIATLRPSYFVAGATAGGRRVFREIFVDSSVKNLREWVGLLFALFCVLDIAGVQYGVHLAQISPDHPDPVAGKVVALISGPRGAWNYVYVTLRQSIVLYGMLGAAGLSLLATLGLLIGDGMRQAVAARRPLKPRSAAQRSSTQRKR